MSFLVIVESPAKARTLSKILGKDFTVKASIGHIKDLPAKELGVDKEHGFEPKYVIIPGKEKVVRELKAASKKAEKV
ncbi:MAG: toprim domain-containing protein, partial [Nitrospiraceae bacterium]|nr:toprim domain-containing protein [Nitrospiraceae bacterium]